MMRCTKTCLALAVGLAAGPATAAPTPPGPLQAAIGDPAGLRLSGSVRTRIESISEQVRPGLARNEELFLVRSTLLAEVGNGPVRLVAELWDSRSYTIRPGSAAGTGEVNTLEPVQAHVAADLGALLGPDSAVAVKAGRMVLNLGSRRLVAADDYRNTTNGYTGLRVDWRLRPDVAGTFVYVLPQQRLPADFDAIRRNRPALDRESFDVRLWGGVADLGRAGGLGTVEASGFRLDERDSPGLPSRDRGLTTLALRLVAPPARGAFDHDIEGAWQWGHERAGLSNALPVQPVAAWFVHADAGYSFRGGVNPRLAVQFDAISGERPGGKYTRFDTLFGMRRADFSPGSLLSTTGRANMLAPAIRLELLPSARTDAFVTARAMWADSASDGFSTTGVRDPTGKSGRFAGYEFDTRARHWLVPGRLRAEWDGVLLLRRGVLQNAPNAPRGNVSFYAAASLISYF